MEREHKPENSKKMLNEVIYSTRAADTRSPSLKTLQILKMSCRKSEENIYNEKIVYIECTIRMQRK